MIPVRVRPLGIEWKRAKSKNGKKLAKTWKMALGRKWGKNAPKWQFPHIFSKASAEDSQTGT